MMKLRKHPLFFHREYTLDLISRDGEYKVIRNLLMLGLLYRVHGYIYREKKLRYREDVADFFSNLFFPRNELGIIKEIEFHKYKKGILKIIDLYEPKPQAIQKI